MNSIPLRRALAIALLAILPAPSALAEDAPALDKLSHVHGIAVDPGAPADLLLATHEGLVRTNSLGRLRAVSTLKADLMGFAADPAEPRRFYASGHPPEGGNLGVLVSDDAGATWRPLSSGHQGPVDFHAMTVSPADARVLYGLGGDALQVSRDRGRTWQPAGPAPERTIDLAASAADARRLYAATLKGFYVSTDGGGTWQPAPPQGASLTMVHLSDAGTLYAFVYGYGLIRTDDAGGRRHLLSGGFGDRYLLHMAVAPDDPERLYAVANTGAVLTSGDGGRTWISYENSHRWSPEVVARGRALYADSCQSCHGENGVGERPDDMYAEDDYGFVAPPLDNSAHAWHHPDWQLIESIQKGSPRNERMRAFADTLAPDDSWAIVAYIKTLWNPRSLACQGARHMACMR